MIDKYQNKYRIPSARLRDWDYGSNGAYFITICTANREHFFGEIDTLPLKFSNVSTMQLSKIGKLSEQYWLEIPKHFPFIELGNFVVMPNHIHGILIIDKTNHVPNVETLQCNFSTITKNLQNENMAKISPNSGTISTIIRSYKSVVSKHARFLNASFSWQSRFHDHIIRNSESFERIQNYIVNNPMSWNTDKFKLNDV